MQNPDVVVCASAIHCFYEVEGGARRISEADRSASLEYTVASSRHLVLKKVEDKDLPSSAPRVRQHHPC